MYQLYSKSYCKAAVDLNKKDFKDKHKHKVTAKGKCNGMSVEANASDAPDKKTNAFNDADVKFSIPVDDAMSMSLKTKATKDSEIEVSYKATDAADISCTIENPDTTLATTKIKGSLTYLDPLFSVESAFTVFDGEARGKVADTGNKFATGTHGASFAVAFDCPAVPDVKVGVQPAFGLDASGYIFNMPFLLAGGTKDLSMAMKGGITLKDGKPTLCGGSVATHFKIMDGLSCAVECDNTTFAFDKYDIYKPVKPAEAKDQFAFKTGLEYKMTKSTTVKGKATYDGSKISWDGALKTALDGKSSVAVGVSLKESAAPQVAFTFNLE